jgi:hypothetical protein
MISDRQYILSQVLPDENTAALLYLKRFRALPDFPVGFVALSAGQSPYARDEGVVPLHFRWLRYFSD